MSKETTKLTYEQELEQKNIELLQENQDMRNKIYNLESANFGLLQALNATKSMLNDVESKGKARI